VFFTCNVDLKLASSLHFRPAIQSNYNGAIDVNGQTLTIDTYNTYMMGAVNGSGAIVITGTGVQLWNGGAFTGTVSGVADVEGSMPGTNITTSKLSGNGAVGTVSGGQIFPGAWDLRGSADPHSVGVLHTKTFTASGLSIDLKPSATSDQVQVSGTVTISGALVVTIPSGVPQVGQTFTIIDNDGVDPINGTFSGMLEGSTFSLGGQVMRISYHGGDGNDVVLVVVVETSTALTQNASATKVGEMWTLTAAISSALGVPTGSVSFAADGTVLGTAPAVNGVASLTTSLPSAGPHHVIATFLGSGIFADSISNSLSHDVTHGQTTTTISSNPSNTVYAQTVRFTITVSPVAPAAGTPGGSVTILSNGATVGTAPLIGGSATFETNALHAGTNAMTATYAGDSNFDGNSASAIQQNVAKASTEVDARFRSTIVAGELPIITIFVNASPNLSVVPTGAVTISERGIDLGTQSLVDGKAQLTLSPLSPGAHTLIVRYGGNADFEPGSETITQSVTVPAIAVHDLRVTEGNQGVTTVSLIVTLSAAVAAPVRVSFSTLPGTATEGEDYEKASGVIEFASGELTRVIELHIFGDTFPEVDETFSVLLSDPVNGTIEKASAVIVIANDDQMPSRHRPSRH